MTFLNSAINTICSRDKSNSGMKVKSFSSSKSGGWIFVYASYSSSGENGDLIRNYSVSLSGRSGGYYSSSASKTKYRRY